MKHTLFDVSQVQDMGTDDFFSKLDEVELEYDSLLPEAVVRGIKHLSSCYDHYLKQKKKIEDFHEAMRIEAETLGMITLGIPTIEASVEELEKRLRGKLMEIFRGNFPIDIPEGFLVAFAEDDFKFTEENMLNLFMEYTNNGDVGKLLKEETMRNLAKSLFSTDEGYKLTKNKIVIPHFYWIEHCRIWKEKLIGYSSDNWEKPQNWKNAVDMFAKEQRIEHNIGSDLFLIYRDRTKDSDGVFNKQTFEDAEVLLSTKLLKNGKMELVFVTSQLAEAFYNDWIVPAKRM